MDHFESILATLLEAENYWVRRSYKVELTKEEKRDAGKPSMPRPEIDLLAFNLKVNEIILFEAKSYLDSRGVALADLQEQHQTPTGRYKIFTCDKYRQIVFKRIQIQLIEQGMADVKTTFKLGLAAGNIRKNDSDPIRQHMTTRGWLFWSPEDIKHKVETQAERGYENDPAIITAKILMR